MNKSQNFTQYNLYKSETGLVDARTNRALGYLQRKRNPINKDYQTTLTSCKCGDRLYNRRVCKHMRMLQMKVTGKQYVCIKFWGKTYHPEKLLDPGVDLYMAVAETVDGGVRVSWNGEPFRDSMGTSLEVFEALINSPMTLVWTNLLGNRNLGDGWHGHYYMIFVKE